MTQHAKLEQALDELGGAIAAEDSLADGVTERIDRLPHGPLNEAGVARRWMARAAMIVVGVLVGLAAGWQIPHESADAAAPLARADQPSTRADAPADEMYETLVTQHSHNFFLIPKPPEASVAFTANEKVSELPVVAGVRILKLIPPDVATIEIPSYALTAAQLYRFAVPSAAKGRFWGPEEATGFPDTPIPGDVPTAWASRTPDGQAEWLELTYPKAVQPSCVLVFENYKPGAVNKVTVFDGAGKEVEVWAGKDPTPATEKSGVSVIRFTTKTKARKVRIYLDSARVAGWNEIDAVGLIDDSGRLQWAGGATASSTYATDPPPVPAARRAVEARRLGEILTGGNELQRREAVSESHKPTEELTRRVKRLEEMVRKLHKELDELKK